MFLHKYSISLLRLLFTLLVSLGLSDLVLAARPERPNIIFILADDLGWTDLTCQGSKYYETPNIDQLAAEGMTFSHFTVCQNCAPTRAALMSGQYAPRTGIYTVQTLVRGNAADRKMEVPENITRLPLDKITIAQTLKQAGYTTGMFGKWHLGHDSPEYHPAQRGFDEAIVVGRGHFRYATFPKTEVPQGQYLTDFLGDRALDFIERHQNHPFFLYLPHNAVHTPIHAKEALIAKYKEKTTHDGHNDPAYAGMIESLDESVGRITKKLEELSLAKNTILVFTSDNGGLGGYALPNSTKRKGITDNYPLREGKGSLYEGGVRVPLIVRWPEVIEPATSCTQALTHVDVYPTFAQLANADLPADYVLDGVDFSSLLKSPQAQFDRGAIHAHFPGYLQSYIEETTWRTPPVATIREQNWKLMEFFEDGRFELYNLDNDISEQQNLAQQEPERVKQMHKKMLAWRKETGALMPRHKNPSKQ